MCVCIYILWLAITIVPISSNGLHPNSVNWRKRPQWEKEDTNSFSPFLVFRHSSGSLTKLIGHEWGEKTTTGDPSTLQSIIVTSERLIAETKCPVYYCANSLKLSSCATESHWKGFWQPDPSSWTTPSSDLKDEWENIKAWRTQKCELEFLWSGNGPSLLNTLFRNPSWGKLETIQYYSS